MKAMLDKLEELGPLFVLAIIVFIIGNLLTKFVMRIMSKASSLERVDSTVHSFIMSVVRVLMLGLTIIICLSIVKVPMASIIAAISAAGLAVGLALRSSLSNIAGGFMILFTKPMKVGDYVQIGSDEGVVEEISIFYTKLRSFDGREIHIPNGNVSTKSIINMTDEGRRLLIHRIQISYSDDFGKACSIVKGVLLNEDYTLHEPKEPVVCMGGHRDSSIEILVKVWVPLDRYLFATSDILEKVKTAFDVNGITIPFQQIDLHYPDK